MRFINIKEGDVLLYYQPDNQHELEERAVQIGEILEDGRQRREYYHAAIAVNSRQKIEANVNVNIANIIQDGSFDVFQPPLCQSDIRSGLYFTRKLLGQKYDWWLILDDALRYISFGRLYLPRKFIESKERRMKICSSLVKYYFRKAKSDAATLRSQCTRAMILKELKAYPPPSPEDLYLAIQQYRVTR